MWQHEHFSATKRSEKQMEDFRNVLSDCNMQDLGYRGLPWTYNNKKKGDQNVKVRLDRAVACPKWSSMFPQAEVTHIVSSRSDHCLVLLDLENKRKGRKTTKTQRYEMVWEREESLPDEINTAWEGHVSAGNLQEIHQTLKSTMVCLKDWSTNFFGAVSKEIADLKTKLERLLQN
jgi:hypothetical protein